jgi:rRNA maturation endonuclease Nob1
MSGDELNQDQKTDLDQILQDKMNALISLKTKERMVQELSAAKMAEDQKNKESKEQKQEAAQEKKEVQKLSDTIIKEATHIVQ